MDYFKYEQKNVSRMEEVDKDVCIQISYDFETFQTPRMKERAWSFLICFIAVILLFTIIFTISSNSKI